MSRYNNREQYFLELAETSEKYYLDYIRPFKPFDKDSSILEIGCGEGGNLLPFAQMGCKTFGIDIAGKKIENARIFFKDRNLDGEFLCTDIIEKDIGRLKGKFDIILVHDVIEHIFPEQKEIFIQKLKYYMKPDAIAFFAFPAWQMPFGGHQQIGKSKVCSKLPFMHLLPKSWYRGYLKVFKEDPAQIQELMSIKECRMTIEKFEKICTGCGFHIVNRTLWFINPHYRVKFHLKPRKLCRLIGGIPYLRDFFSTSCFFILSV